MEKIIRDNGLARQTAVLNELKSSAGKLSSLGTEDIAIKARQTLLNRSSALPDLKSIDSVQMTAQDQDAMVDLISSEVGSWKKDLLDNYMKIAEKAEKELQNADSEKMQLMSHNVRLSHDLQTLKQQLKVTIEDREKTEITLNHYMTEYEVQSEQLARVRENYEKYEKLHSNIERTLKAQLAKITEESEAKIAELTVSNTKLATDKATLLKEKNNNVSAQITNEEFQKYQADQIAELTLKTSKLSLENEDVKGKNHRLVLENTVNLDKINALQDEVHRITNEYEMRIDQVTKTYELRLKTDVGRKQTEIGKTGERNERFSDLYSLEIPEVDGQEPGQFTDQEFYERERTITDLNQLRMMRADSQNSQTQEPSRKPTGLLSNKVSNFGTIRTTNIVRPKDPSISNNRTNGPPLPSGGISPQPKPSKAQQPDLNHSELYPELDDMSDVRHTSGPNFLVK